MKISYGQDYFECNNDESDKYDILTKEIYDK